MLNRLFLLIPFLYHTDEIMDDPMTMFKNSLNSGKSVRADNPSPPHGTGRCLKLFLFETFKLKVHKIIVKPV